MNEMKLNNLLGINDSLINFSDDVNTLDEVSSGKSFISNSPPEKHFLSGSYNKIKKMEYSFHSIAKDLEKIEHQKRLKNDQLHQIESNIKLTKYYTKLQQTVYRMEVIKNKLNEELKVLINKSLHAEKVELLIQEKNNKISQLNELLNAQAEKLNQLKQQISENESDKLRREIKWQTSIEQMELSNKKTQAEKQNLILKLSESNKIAKENENKIYQLVNFAKKLKMEVKRKQLDLTNITSLKSENEQYIKQLETNFKKKTEEYNSTITEFRNHNKITFAKDIEINNLTNELNNKNQELQKIRATIGKKLANYQREIENYQSTINEIEEKNFILTEQINKLQNSIEEKNIHFDHLSSDNKTLLNKLGLANLRESDFLETLEKSESELDKLNDELIKKTQTIHSLELKIRNSENDHSILIDKLKKEFSEKVSFYEHKILSIQTAHEEKTKSLLVRINGLESQIQKLEYEKRDYKNDLNKISSDFNRTQKVDSDIYDKHQDLVTKYFKSEQEKYDLFLRCSELEDKLKQVDKSVADKETQLKTQWESQFKNSESLHQNEILALTKKFEDESFKLKEHYKLIEIKFTEKLKSLNQQFEDLKKKNETISEDIRIREKKLNYYSISIDKEKTKVRDQIYTLINEVKSFASINPLKSVIELTDKEISRVEIDLAKQPLMSPERARLENILVDLIRQRDSIKYHLSDSDTTLQKKIRNLYDIINAEALSPLPPLPPQ